MTADNTTDEKGTCPCSQGMDRRGFLKAAAVAGLLAGCNPVLQTPPPTVAPTATDTPQPTPEPPKETKVPDLKGKKVLYVLPREQYAVQCHEASEKPLKEYGAKITLAAAEKKEIIVWGGGNPSLMPDVLVGEVKVEEYDAVIFECGQPLEIDNADYLNIAKEAVRQNKVVGAICMMPVLLAAAGVLDGKKATSNGTDMPTLQRYGAVLDFYNDPVRDGNIITSSFGGEEKFGKLIVEALME